MKFSRISSIIRASAKPTESPAKVDTLVWAALEALSVSTARASGVPTVDERINERAGLMQRIAKCNENGWIAVVESGRDCDGVKYSGRVHDCEANPQAYHKLCSDILSWADGPCGFYITHPSAAAEISYESRDLGAEAFENGHPHALYI